jgi:UDP-GlcNAc3NAcA epimerase
MIKILTIIGARPQIIKAAAVSRAIRNHFADKITEVIIHTGQHYDTNMSQVFIEELAVPQPHYNLAVGSGPHGRQTALMIEGIENIIRSENPDFLLVYGDTNSTLAGGVAASKVHVPVVHVEAGLRSFNKSMPEEINRILCDHVSTLLFTPTLTGLNNLMKEGFVNNKKLDASIDNPHIYHCGDIMYDNSLFFSQIADERSSILTQIGITGEPFILATIHRDNNTDNPERLNSIFSALNELSKRNSLSIIVPLHPRTSGLLSVNLDSDLYNQVKSNNLLKVIQPVSFLDMIQLEKNAELIITDSGGVQKEAYFFRKPCVIARPETEWVEIVEAGAGRVCDADRERILESAGYFLSKPVIDYKQVFGDGKAAEFICRQILSCSKQA